MKLSIHLFENSEKKIYRILKIINLKYLDQHTTTEREKKDQNEISFAVLVGDLTQ